MIKLMVSGSRFKVQGSKLKLLGLAPPDSASLQFRFQNSESRIQNPESSIRFLFRYYNIFFSGLIILTLIGCKSWKDRLNIDVSGISIKEIKIHRYDNQLFQINITNLKPELERLKPEFRFFLDTDLNDPGKLIEMTTYLENPRNLDFSKEVQKRFKDLHTLEKDLTEAFRHYKYYYPSARIPRVYSYISGGDYEDPVQFADSVLLIGIDNYLGKDYKAYVSDGLPAYRVERMTPGNIIPDCMRVLAKVSRISAMSGNTLLDEMIGAGKQLYFIDAMIPGTDDRYKIGYTTPQAEWIKKNESHVWAAIIENRMLYSSDGQTIRTFMADGPFTAEFSKESPTLLGDWIGWQIVKKYMANEETVTLNQLMEETDAQKVLTLSKYKPEK